MAEPQGFLSSLRSRLGQSDKVRIYHVSTPPSPSASLFAPGPGQAEEPTTLESHFLCLSQTLQCSQPSGCVSSELRDVLILGIEVLIFATDRLTTVFVSKADSTGLLQRSAKVAPGRTSLIQTVITAFLEHLLTVRFDRTQVVLSLFARSQNQYLFPGSIENVTKHVLDDRQLIKWWCRVLDPVARQLKNPPSWSVKAHVVVPGLDRGETKAFFPPSTRSDSTTNPLWLHAYPVNLLVEDVTLPLRCLVPRLPDDPKSRFLDDLDAHRDEHGHWRGIKTLDQFWEMMSYRQECSAGRLVGFVWIVFTPAKASEPGVSDATPTIRREEHQPRPQKEPPVSMSSPTAVTTELVNTPTARVSADVTPPSTAPATTTSDDSGQSLRTGTLAENSHLRRDNRSEETVKELYTSTLNASASRSERAIVLSPENYQKLMDCLLELDFGGETMAAVSSNKWREKALELAGVSQFGIEVEGAAPQAGLPTVTQAVAQTGVNILTNVRRKRKVEQADTTSSNGKVEAVSINTLPTNLVRKKPKA